MSPVVNAIHTSIHPHTQVISRTAKLAVPQGLTENNSLLEFPDSLIKRPVSLPTTDTSGALGSTQVASPSEPLETNSMSTFGKVASVNEVSPIATLGRAASVNEASPVAVSSRTAAAVKLAVSPRASTSLTVPSPDALPSQDVKFPVPRRPEDILGADTHIVSIATDDPYVQAESARNGESEEESAVSSANDLEILIAERELAKKELEIAKLRKQASSKNSHRSGRSDKSRSERRKAGKSALPLQASSSGQPHSPTVQTLEGRLNAEAEPTSNLNAETLLLHNLSNDSRPISPARDPIQEEHQSTVPKRENNTGEHLSPEQKKCRWTRKPPSESSPHSTVNYDSNINFKKSFC